MRRLLASVLALGLCGVARANLVLEIDGVTPSSPTVWELTGSGTSFGTFFDDYFEYTNVGEFFPSTATLFSVSGTADFTNQTTAQTVSITSVFLSDANGGTIGFNLDAPFTAGIGDVISWSSSSWQFSNSESDFSSLGVPYQNLNIPSSTTARPNLDLMIGGQIVSVPEASSIAFGGCALAAACIAMAIRRWSCKSPGGSSGRQLA